MRDRPQLVNRRGGNVSAPDRGGPPEGESATQEVARPPGGPEKRRNGLGLAELAASSCRVGGTGGVRPKHRKRSGNCLCSLCRGAIVPFLGPVPGRCACHRRPAWFGGVLAKTATEEEVERAGTSPAHIPRGFRAVASISASTAEVGHLTPGRAGERPSHASPRDLAGTAGGDQPRASFHRTLTRNCARQPRTAARRTTGNLRCCLAGTARPPPFDERSDMAQVPVDTGARGKGAFPFAAAGLSPESRRPPGLGPQATWTGGSRSSRHLNAQKKGEAWVQLVEELGRCHRPESFFRRREGTSCFR